MDVEQLSVLPFDQDERLIEKLRTIPSTDGVEALYLKTINNGVQKLSLNNKYNLEFQFGRHYSQVTAETIFKKVINSWYDSSVGRE